MDLSKFDNAISINKKLIKKYNKDKVDIEKDLEEDNLSLNKLKNAREMLISISSLSRDSAIETLKNTVNIMLKSTLSDRYTFSIELEKSANKPVVNFYIEEDVDGIISRQDIVEDSGGGIQDIVATALRFAFLLIFNDGSKGPLILDEPARMISESKSYEYAKFLSDMASSNNKQIIMCTHNLDMKTLADNLIEITK